MKVIFMGTPQFSCPSLEKLISDPGIEIVAVYTKESSISGRGHKVHNSPIHDLALKNKLKVLTPKSLKKPEIITEFLAFKADAAVVVAYGLILPKAIINGPKFGCINLHPSYLPRWRGAAPIQRTILSGDRETATTIIKMDEEIDSGPIINQEVFILDEGIDYPKLAEKFANDGANLVLKSLKELHDGKANLKEQNHALATYAKKIEKAESLIDWSKSATEINRQIRAFTGNFGSYFIHEQERIKIIKARIINENQQNENYSQILNNQMFIACGTGIIQPLILQREGKKEMDLEQFLKGFVF